MLKRWVLYHLLSLLIVLGTIYIEYYCIAYALSDALSAIICVFNLQCVIISLISVLQVIIVLINQRRPSIKLKFAVAFCCIYSLISTVLYAYFVGSKYQLKEIYDMAGSNGMYKQNLGEFNQNPFIGLHTFLIFPILLQFVVFVVLFRKNNQLTTLNEKSN